MNSARILAFLVLVHEYRLLSRRSDSLREPVILVRLGNIHAQIPSLKDPFETLSATNANCLGFVASRSGFAPPSVLLKHHRLSLSRLRTLLPVPPVTKPNL